MWSQIGLRPTEDLTSALEPRARDLPLDHRADEPADLRVPLSLHMAEREGIAPGGEAALFGELVEVPTRNRHVDALVLREALRHARARELDPVRLHVATAAQLDAEDELQVRECGRLCLDALDSALDQVGRRRHS